MVSEDLLNPVTDLKAGLEVPEDEDDRVYRWRNLVLSCVSMPCLKYIQFEEREGMTHHSGNYVDVLCEEC